MKAKFILPILFLIFSIKAFSQNATAKVAGIVLDEKNQPVEGVNVSYLSKSVSTNADGFYTITVPANQKVVLIFTHVSLKKITATLQLKPGENFEFHVAMSENAEQLNDVVITNNRRRVQGITTLEPETVRKNPSANAGVESVLKTFGGVSGNNELSSGYNVRGGNYDENLVYVNEIEYIVRF